MGTRIAVANNLVIVGLDTAQGASAAASLALLNVIVPPPGNITNGVQLYSEDVAASAELKVYSEAGNITTLSLHSFSLIPKGPSESMAWS